MSYARADFFRLASNEAGASAYGALEWIQINRSWRGTCGVTAAGFEPGVLRLQIKIPVLRPSEPTAIYLVGGHHMRRVDVNGAHRGRRSTHTQWAESAGGPEQFEELPGWSAGPGWGDTVSSETYRRVLGEAAALFRIDISGMEWIDPPGVGDWQ